MTQPLATGSLAGKRALVTGSSRGIGADTVSYFAKAGADVVVNFRNKAPRAEKLAAQLREFGVRALVQGADLTDPESLATMFSEVQREFGGLDGARIERIRRYGKWHGRGLRAQAEP